MLPEETKPLWTIGYQLSLATTVSPQPSSATAVSPQPSLAIAVSHQSSCVMSVCLHSYPLVMFSWPFLFPHSSYTKLVSHQSSRVSCRFFSGAKVCFHPFVVPILSHHSTWEVANLSQKPSLEMTVAHPSILDYHYSTWMTLFFQDSLNTTDLTRNINSNPANSTTNQNTLKY